MVTASATGLFRTLLIIVGALFLLRFLGQLMNAKRNMQEERDLNVRQRQFNEEKNKSVQSHGKTRVIRKSESQGAEDVDFEEVD